MAGVGGPHESLVRWLREGTPGGREEAGEEGMRGTEMRRPAEGGEPRDAGRGQAALVQRLCAARGRAACTLETAAKTAHSIWCRLSTGLQIVSL